MKKLIAILAVFAIMVPALFAQDEGSWSIGGKGQIGTRVDVTPWEYRNEDNENSDQTVPLVGMTSYQDYQQVRGQFTLTYSRGSVWTGLGFNQQDRIAAFVGYDDGQANFYAESKAGDLLNGGAFTNMNLLYGGYKFLDGIIDLQVAVRSNWRNDLWVSSNLIGDLYSLRDGGNFMSVNVAPIDGLTLGFILPGIFDAGLDLWAAGFSSTQQDALTTMVNVNGPTTTGWAGLNAGAYRRLIQDSVERMTFGLRYGTGPFNAAVQYGLRGRPMFYEEGTQNILDTTFLNSVLYFGAQFDINSNMRAEVDVRGEFFKSFDMNRDSPDTALEDVSRTALAVSGRFRYTDGPLQAYLAVFYFNDIWTAAWAGTQRFPGVGAMVGGHGSIATTPASSRSVEGGVLRLRPFFRYNVIPSHLQFRVDTKLDIPLSEWALNGFVPYELDVKNEYAEGDDLRGYRHLDPDGNAIRSYALGYEFVPEVFFNVMGTGATDGVDMDANFTGIAIRYRLAGLMYTGDLFNKRASLPTRNAFDIIFRWTF